MARENHIVPHLWFDKEAKEAAELYTSLFDNSKIESVSQIQGTPSGDCDIVSFTLRGMPFMAISAGPYFKPNPSISFMINYDPLMFGGKDKTKEAKKALTDTWQKFIDGGKILMPLQEYPFSELYGWVSDKYGFSWQLIFTKPEGDERPTIIPSFLFVGKKAGKAEEAVNFYASVFKDSKKSPVVRYPAGMEPEKEGTVMFTDFKLLETWFAAMDSANPGHTFDFNEAVSMIVKCDTQKEIDYYWDKLSAVPEAEQCGWLKDKFGVSWQIVPRGMDDMMATSDKDALKRVTEAFLKMKKFDVATLEKAYKEK